MATVQYQLTRDEVLRSVLRRRMLSPGRLILGGLLLAGGVMLLALPLHAADTGAFIILLVLAMNGLLYVVLRRAVDKATWLTAPTTLEYGESGIALDAGGIRQELQWIAFGRWKRTAPHVLLFLGRTDNALHIPVRALTAAQLAEITGLLLAHVGPERR